MDQSRHKKNNKFISDDDDDNMQPVKTDPTSDSNRFDL